MRGRSAVCTVADDSDVPLITRGKNLETLESILVGIDGSERGKKALKWAARLATVKVLI